MRWIDIIHRDKICIYCGTNEFALLVISLDGKKATSVNSAACCKLCYKTNARKTLGARGSRVMMLEVARRNAEQGISPEDVEPATRDEKVDLGLIKPRWQKRDYLGYSVSEPVQINFEE